MDSWCQKVFVTSEGWGWNADWWKVGDKRGKWQKSSNKGSNFTSLCIFWNRLVQRPLKWRSALLENVLWRHLFVKNTKMSKRLKHTTAWTPIYSKLVPPQHCLHTHLLSQETLQSPKDRQFDARISLRLPSCKNICWYRNSRFTLSTLPQTPQLTRAHSCHFTCAHYLFVNWSKQAAIISALMQKSQSHWQLFQDSGRRDGGRTLSESPPESLFLMGNTLKPPPCSYRHPSPHNPSLSYLHPELLLMSQL